MTTLDDRPVQDRIQERLAHLSPLERTVAEARLGRILTRQRALAKYRTPTELALGLGGPSVVTTPLTRMLDSVLVAAEAGYRTRWIVNTPPQEGKTMTINQWGMLWLLLRDPGRRIGVASYEQNIAARSGLQVRQWVESYGSGYAGGKVGPDHEDHLGLLLDPRRSQSTAWSLSGVHGENGGMISVGIGSALTGRSLNVLVVDDPLKDAEQADSLIYRERVWNWWQATASTRLSGHTIVIVVQTRWHEDDLSGRLMEEDAKRRYPQWSRLVVPAQAEEGDPLGRAPGEFLESVWGRTEEEWRDRRDTVGSRWWFAMYQQAPAPPAGGVFQRAWFERHRVRSAPELVYSGVWVDPADNLGTGDEAGVIYAGLGVDGRIYLIRDRSKHMTVHQMLRRAILLCARHRAHVIRLEKSLSGLKRNAEKAWKDVRWQAGVLQAFWRADVRERGQDPKSVVWPSKPPEKVLERAVAHMLRDDAGPMDRADMELSVFDPKEPEDSLWPLVPAILRLPAKAGPPMSIFQARGTKTWRATNASPVYERGDVSHVGPQPRLEHQMASWQEAQDSPDRMDAAVHAVTELAARQGVTSVEAPTGTIPQRTHRAQQTITRSTR